MNIEEGRKINEECESLVDDALIRTCKPVADALYTMSNGTVTPNMITTVGLFVGILGIVALTRGAYITSFILLWVCYWFDCLDGYYARKFKMETQFGDYYDHVRDVVIVGAFIGILALKLPRDALPFFIVSMTISIFLILYHIGCQELNSNHQSANKSLAPLKQICANKRNIRISKLAGCSLIIIVLSFFILVLSSYKHKH